MKKRITALLIAAITSLAAMPVNPVFADTIEPEVMPEIQETELIQECDNLQEADLVQDTFNDVGAEDDTEAFCGEEPDMECFLNPMNSFSESDMESSALEDNKAVKRCNAYISRDGNDESRSFYFHGYKKKPTKLYYKSSIGSAKVVKVGRNNYAVKFTFKKGVKKSVQISFQDNDYTTKLTRKFYLVNNKITYKCAAHNIKLGKIRLSGFNKNFYWAERPVSGYIEITPASGWQLVGVYKCPVFGKSTGLLHNGDKIVLEKYEEAKIYFQNITTKQYVVYIYRALT